jgi:hypothetical protein
MVSGTSPRQRELSEDDIVFIQSFFG